MNSLRLLLTMTACALLAQAVAAQEDCGTPDCCAACRGRAPCQEKVCRVVCDTQEVKKTYWCVKREEFCAPLPSWPHLLRDWYGLLSALGCQGSNGAPSDPCYGGDGCGASGKHGADPPNCGRVRTRKKLVKKEYTCEVPVYKCVVKYLCSDCSADCDAEEAEGPLKPETEPTAAPKPLPGRQAFQIAPLPPL